MEISKAKKGLDIGREKLHRLGARAALQKRPATHGAAIAPNSSVVAINRARLVRPIRRFKVYGTRFNLTFDDVIR